MSKLISIVGASGVGKTVLARALEKAHSFTTAFEQHEERPFQILFKQDKKFALANQIDYFLLRAEQEKDLRSSPQIGLLDGGLDLDFYGFTRLFLNRNLLNQNEFDLCRRVYIFIRETLPMPELIISLRADEETVADRMSRRKRINIASAEDTSLLNSYIDEWLASIPSDQVMELDVTHESIEYSQSVEKILNRIANW